MKQERWKVALAVIFLLASGFWYSHLYYDGKVIQETAPAVETVEVAVHDAINLNTASKEELMLLDGIGEKMAERILAYREENGPFCQNRRHSECKRHWRKDLCRELQENLP